MSTRHSGGTIDEAIAAGKAALDGETVEQSKDTTASLQPSSPAKKRLAEIQERLDNPTAPQLKFFKRQVKGGYDLLFEIKWKGETFSRAIMFKSRHDLQSASALVLAIVKGLFAEENEADRAYFESVQQEMKTLIEEIQKDGSK